LFQFAYNWKYLRCIYFSYHYITALGKPGTQLWKSGVIEMIFNEIIGDLTQPCIPGLLQKGLLPCPERIRDLGRPPKSVGPVPRRASRGHPV
jgi:hypothetical protein